MRLACEVIVFRIIKQEIPEKKLFLVFLQRLGQR